MTHYKSMFDSEYLGHWDLMGKEVTVEIASVEAGELTAPGGRKSRKPVVHFTGAKKGLALNKTNAKVIAGLYGVDTDEWPGKRITLFPTTTAFGAETVECIRVKPEVPKAKPQAVAS